MAAGVQIRHKLVTRPALGIKLALCMLMCGCKESINFDYETLRGINIKNNTSHDVIVQFVQIFPAIANIQYRDGSYFRLFTIRRESSQMIDLPCATGVSPLYRYMVFIYEKPSNISGISYYMDEATYLSTSTLATINLENRLIKYAPISLDVEGGRTALLEISDHGLGFQQPQGTSKN